MKFDGKIFEGNPKEMLEFYFLVGKKEKKLPSINKHSKKFVNKGTTQKVVDFLNNNIRMEIRSNEIEKGLNMKQGNYSPVLSRLVKNKNIERVGSGLYYVPRFIDYNSRHYRRRKKREHKRWDVKQDNDLKDLVNSGASISKISDKMGRTYDSIYSRLKKIKGQGVSYPNQSYYLKGDDVQ